MLLLAALVLANLFPQPLAGDPCDAPVDRGQAAPFALGQVAHQGAARDAWTHGVDLPGGGDQIASLGPLGRLDLPVHERPHQVGDGNLVGDGFRLAGFENNELKTDGIVDAGIVFFAVNRPQFGDRSRPLIPPRSTPQFGGYWTIDVRVSRYDFIDCISWIFIPEPFPDCPAGEIGFPIDPTGFLERDFLELKSD